MVDPSPISLAVDAANADSNRRPFSGLYTDPIDPRTDEPLRNRFQLIQESLRPWNEFASPSEFDVPKADECKSRIERNVEDYFYNCKPLATRVHLRFRGSAASRRGSDAFLSTPACLSGKIAIRRWHVLMY